MLGSGMGHCSVSGKTSTGKFPVQGSKCHFCGTPNWSLPGGRYCCPGHEAEGHIVSHRELNLQFELRSPILRWDNTERFEFLATFETLCCRKIQVFNLLRDRKEIDGALILPGFFFLEELTLLYFTSKLVCSLGSWVEDRHCLAVACLIIPCNFDWQWNVH